ncbi:polysaccharide biosynthesis protein [Rummeliibacillus sp. G93]|uniref:putative polysaccharide biosynthesis protein n=1 Tax=Rummeliibacillus sp. G93 TaxID=2939494 RepID=UPI00201BF4AE|nr:polysaccharide biosynthesis protein [Rummeliibacillus sp. G93]UQW97517.1 polysaccharide biosynthesis protein [Rummeliibacillus sp. G93]
MSEKYMPEKWGMKVYLKGVAMLTVASLFVKVLSMVYRIPFQNLVGDRGFYIYQQVYPFAAIFVTWTSSGLAVAISKILADEDANKHTSERNAILRFLFSVLAVISALLFIVLFFGAPFFAKMMGDQELAGLIKVASFVVFCIPFLSIYKGFFQSMGNMQPVAYAQMVEQAVRVAIIIVGTWQVVAMTHSLYAAGEVAMGGTVAGELAGVFLLVWFGRKYFFSHEGLKSTTIQSLNKWAMTKKLLLFSFSVSLSSLMLLLFQLVDSFTIFSALQKMGLPSLRAMETKGIYDRSQPLVQVGLVIASSLSLAIVPLIAHNQKNREHAKRYIKITYRASLLFGVAAAVGLILVMPNINKTLFETADLSNVLSIFIIQIIWLSLILTITGILQGLGKLKIPSFILLMGILVKCLCNSLFVQTFGIGGAAIAGNMALMMSAIVLVAYLKKLQTIKLAPWRFYKGLTVATLLMAFVLVLFSVFLEPYARNFSDGRTMALCLTIIKSSIGAFIFLTSLAKMRTLAVREWFLLPLGKYMAAYQLRLGRMGKDTEEKVRQ